MPSFFIFHSECSVEVCARRTDYDGDWSIHLKVMCRRASDADSQSGKAALAALAYCQPMFKRHWLGSIFNFQSKRVGLAAPCPNVTKVT